MVHSFKPEPWQTALINAVTEPKELLALLDLDMNLLPEAEKAALLFPFKVTREFINRMQKGNLNDPLLLQILPLSAEMIEAPNFVEDPLQEKIANPLPGLLHKYHGRVLLTLTGACAVNCRFCFRRHFPYSDNNPGKRGWEAAVNYIANDPSISEVILSGGDPLVMNDALLIAWAEALANVPHIKRLRIHSRLPIVLPGRITTALVQGLARLRLKPVLVVHCNHPQEINEEVIRALSPLRGHVTLLNQSVLLRNINDLSDTLIQLSETLFEAGILPYYLNLLDPVRGSTHFEVPVAKAIQLHEEMRRRLPGYLVPRLVYERPKAPSKLPVLR